MDKFDFDKLLRAITRIADATERIADELEEDYSGLNEDLLEHEEEFLTHLSVVPKGPRPSKVLHGTITWEEKTPQGDQEDG